MKKFIYATLAVAAVLLFASCKNDKNQPKAEAGDAYVSFTFNLPQGGTRAGVDDKHASDLYAGTKDEQKITAVRVVLFDEDSKLVKYALDYAITGDGENPVDGDDKVGTSTAAKFTTKAKEVVTQDYLMLAIINPTAEVKAATEVNKTLLDAQAAITTDATKLSAAGILMSNDRGLVKVKSTNMKTVATDAEAAPVSVNVDRILAKVFVGGDPTFANGKLTNIKWQLNTTNKKTFIYRQFGQVNTGLNTFVDETAGDNSTRFDRYAKDPNFSGAFNAADFNYLEGVPTLTGTTGFEDAKGQYCLENTMDATSQKIQQTTTFILSGNWTPAEHDGITFAEGQTWYYWKGWSFTKAKMLEYKTIIDDASNAKTEIDETPAGFKAALKAAFAAGLTVDAQGDVTAAGTFGEVQAYKDGFCYYQSNLIRHFNDAQSKADMGYGRYGVVRNNIYKINLKKISRPGTPTVTNDENNDKNDDPSKSYISFDVSVNPWIVREQDIEL